MAMELILLENVDGLGKMGDKVRAADGYARNFLLPRGLGAPATKENLRRLEVKKRQLQKHYEESLAIAQSLAERISKLSVTIPVQAGENDKLYGSVTSIQISEALTESGVEINRHAIMLEEPLRELGVYNVDIQLHAEVKTALKVWVVRA